MGDVGAQLSAQRIIKGRKGVGILPEVRKARPHLILTVDIVQESTADEVLVFGTEKPEAAVFCLQRNLPVGAQFQVFFQVVPAKRLSLNGIAFRLGKSGKRHRKESQQKGDRGFRHHL